MARLSTHVLDTARGMPAAGITIDLYRLDGHARRHVARAFANAEGRTDQPLLSGDRLETGVYELMFFAGDYFRGLNLDLPAPPFLDEIVVRIGVSDPQGNYHVPLLLSPYGYSTYRGS